MVLLMDHNIGFSNLRYLFKVFYAPADVSHLWLQQLQHYVFLNVFPNASAAVQQEKLILQLCPQIQHDPLKNRLVSLYPESEYL